MQFQQTIPVYLPFGFFWEEEREQERDRKVMQSFYSRTASRIQEKVDRECDRMEYDGSMMFDEYPDRRMMEHLCGCPRGRGTGPDHGRRLRLPGSDRGSAVQ